MTSGLLVQQLSSDFAAGPAIDEGSVLHTKASMRFRRRRSRQEETGSFGVLSAPLDASCRSELPAAVSGASAAQQPCVQSYRDRLGRGPTYVHDGWLVERAEAQFSTLPSSVRRFLLSKEFLSPPCSRRAQYAFQEIPGLAAELEAVNTCGPPGEEWCGSFLSSAATDEKLFVSVVDAALLQFQRIRRSGRPLTDHRNVLVVGGGPAGMLAAIEAAALGCSVEVVELRPTGVRTRNLGMFPRELWMLARLGAPRELFNDAFGFARKNGIALFDLELFLGAIALKMGAAIYRNAQAMPTPEGLASGVLRCVRHAGGRTVVPDAVDRSCIIRTRQSSCMHLSDSEIELHFSVLVNCEGSRQHLTRLLAGDESVVSLVEIAHGQMEREPDQGTYSFTGDDHIHSSVADADWDRFSRVVREDHRSLPTHVTSFIANCPRSLFKRDSEVPHLMPRCPVEWIGIPLPHHSAAEGASSGPASPKGLYEGVSAQSDSLAGAFGLRDSSIARVLVEGMLPHTYKGRRTPEVVDEVDPVVFLLALLDSVGAGSVVDEDGLLEYFATETGWENPGQNSACIFTSNFAGLNTSPSKPLMHGVVPGSAGLEYYILGDAAQSPWFRFGVGVHDAFNTVDVLSRGLSEEAGLRAAAVLEMEAELRRRAVQVVCYHWRFGEQLSKDAAMRAAMRRAVSDQPSTMMLRVQTWASEDCGTEASARRRMSLFTDASPCSGLGDRQKSVMVW
eukprot:TRINITY_DN29686_c0_g1_i1.p1 TRINITY_DN29686_c0_g1~~TRINITY_DN29686_c0_g1_i1.p1  ORF type:complete len:732 (+),score=118.57 TRINITY_DN29686_c0_g1_i1:87-2282(+)